MAKIVKNIFYFSLCCVVFIRQVLCDEELDESTIWDDDPSVAALETNFDDNNRTLGESIERSLNLEPSANIENALEQNLKNVDVGKLLKTQDRNKGIVTSSFAEEKRKNIQKVATKMINLDEKNLNKSRLEVMALTNVSFEINADSSDIAWMMRIFNLATWNPEEIPGVNYTSHHCASLLHQYLRALQNGTLWATKMSDATGRYTSQFFFGNDFWLGSQTLCLNLHNKAYNNYIPPFPVHFFIAKFHLRMPVKLKQPRFVSIGLCLPRDCSTGDVKALLEDDAKKINTGVPARSLAVVSVRAVPGSYSLLADKKLHLLLTILIAVVALTIIGTCYEISLERKKHRWYKKQQSSIISSNNNENDLQIITPFEKIPALEIKRDNEYNLKESPTDTCDLSFKNSGEGGNTMSQFILSFSAITNSRKILHVGPAPEDSLNCVHGLRFLSLLWVIMVHTYLQVFTVAENKDLRTLAEINFMFQTVSNATFSVDTFFFISGLLVTYLYFKTAVKENDKTRRKNATGCVPHFFKFLKLVGYRFLRLTPAYMFVLLIAEISMRWIHDISVFEPQSQNHISCDKYWWRNLLYINSLYPMKDMCMLWSWYVSNDTQFYILGILILLFSARYFRFSVIMLMLSLFVSWAITITISLVYDYRAKIDDPFLLFDELYDKPWTRLGPYLIGMCAGWFLFKTKCKIHLSKTNKSIYWLLSAFTLFALVYGLHIYPLGAVGSSLYVSVGHTAWGLALAWIVIACCSGHGGFVDSFLSYKLLHPLSRLTYCAYLVHPIVMTTTNFQMNAPLHLHNLLVMIIYFGNTLASFILSFFISLLFEAPVVRVLKLISSPKPKKRASKIQTNL